MFSGVWLSSGTGIVWGNTIPSSTAGGGTGVSNFIFGRVNRAGNNPYVQLRAPYGWGYCGTAFRRNRKLLDQTSNSATGYACLDQIGRGAGQLLVQRLPRQSTTQLEPVHGRIKPWSPSTSGPTLTARCRAILLTSGHRPVARPLPRSTATITWGRRIPAVRSPLPGRLE